MKQQRSNDHDLNDPPKRPRTGENLSHRIQQWCDRGRLRKYFDQECMAIRKSWKKLVDQCRTAQVTDADIVALVLAVFPVEVDRNLCIALASEYFVGFHEPNATLQTMKRFGSCACWVAWGGRLFLLEWDGNRETVSEFWVIGPGRLRDKGGCEVLLREAEGPEGVMSGAPPLQEPDREGMGLYSVSRS